MKLTLSWPAPAFTVIAPDAFDGNVGKEINVKTSIGNMPGTILAVDVEDGGQRVNLTLDVPELEEGIEAYPPAWIGHMSWSGTDERLDEPRIVD